eukprot:8519518-Pyramimonas_sp.AAC.1
MTPGLAPPLEGPRGQAMRASNWWRTKSLGSTITKRLHRECTPRSMAKAAAACPTARAARAGRARRARAAARSRPERGCERAAELASRAVGWGTSPILVRRRRD